MATADKWTVSMSKLLKCNVTMLPQYILHHCRIYSLCRTELAVELPRDGSSDELISKQIMLLLELIANCNIDPRQYVAHDVPQFWTPEVGQCSKVYCC